AVFTYMLQNQRLLPQLKALAREAQAWLVFGTPHLEKDKSYNSIVAISPQGEVLGRYDKCQLVPFGEYLPFKTILYPILKRVGYYEAEFAPGQPRGLKVGRFNIAAAICFESVFPNLIKERVKADSDFILLVTNDAWFNDSSALYFHLNCGVFRAIENHSYFIQVGNTGISAVIDPLGRVLEKTRVNHRETLIFEIPLP
ncbi:MAG: apolipoprotein N-acyltransferase, partial [Candidatus Margulisbacteria bacterium]|nr:apolipoprotein N-acyltransferase [Candidatus Margulisiibacteriota bacterium]